MSEDVTLSREDYEALMQRLSQMEERLESMQANADEPEDKEEPEEKESESRNFEEAADMFSDVFDASMAAFKEAARKAREFPNERPDFDDMPGSMVSMMRFAVDLQKRMVDTFEETYQKKH